MTVRKILAQLMSVFMNLSVMKLNEDDDWMTDEVCQHLLKKQKKAQLWILVMSLHRANHMSVF